MHPGPLIHIPNQTELDRRVRGGGVKQTGGQNSECVVAAGAGLWRLFRGWLIRHVEGGAHVVEQPQHRMRQCCQAAMCFVGMQPHILRGHFVEFARSDTICPKRI